jgi:hypothetical protein
VSRGSICLYEILLPELIKGSEDFSLLYFVRFSKEEILVDFEMTSR